jgi:hypothetical protein
MHRVKNNPLVWMSQVVTLYTVKLLQQLFWNALSAVCPAPVGQKGKRTLEYFSGQGGKNMV